MVMTNDPQAEEYILKLADVYRQTLKKERTTVSLQEEIGFLQSYLYLIRYGQENDILFDINVPETSLDYRLPIFSLQWLGENCIKNNAYSSTNPLRIQLFQKDSKSITISNNQQLKVLPNESFEVGIQNLKMRYALEGIEEAVTIEQNEETQAITLKVF
jgi:two-component system, LytTR family, sensor kinase